MNIDHVPVYPFGVSWVNFRGIPDTGTGSQGPRVGPKGIGGHTPSFFDKAISLLLARYNIYIYNRYLYIIISNIICIYIYITLCIL